MKNMKTHGVSFWRVSFWYKLFESMFSPKKEK